MANVGPLFPVNCRIFSRQKSKWNDEKFMKHKRHCRQLSFHLFHLFDIFSEIVSFPGILVWIWTWSNLIPWRIWCLYQSLPGTLNNHQVISNFNWSFKEGDKGVSGHEFTNKILHFTSQETNSVIDPWSLLCVRVIWAQLQIPYGSQLKVGLSALKCEVTSKDSKGTLNQAIRW